MREHEQPEFDFATTHARRSDPSTSKRTAASMEIASGRQRRELHACMMANCRPLMSEQVALLSGMPLSAVYRRMGELVTAGLVVVVGEARTTTGRPAALYIAKVGQNDGTC